MNPPPYNNGLPLVRHSLTDFLAHARHLVQEDSDNSEYIQFVLTGVYNDHGLRTQAFVDPLVNHVLPSEPLNISRDYDSLLGICDNIVITCDLSMFAVPHPNFSLRSSIHVKWEGTTAEGLDESIEFHKIPNFELGKFGPRHHIHAFFPKLATSQRRKGANPHQLTRRERELLYKHGIRPAIQYLLGNQASEWPATVETEEIRAKRYRGGYSFLTKVIPKEVVRYLSASIKHFISSDDTLSPEDKEWACSIMYLHTVRGTKNVTSHRVDHHAAHLALIEFLDDSHLPYNLSEVGRWYIDVAIEVISARDRSLQWVASSHANVLEELLSVESEHARRITSIGSSKYALDISSHLTALAGMRCTPGVLAEGPYECKYVQLYTTDKAVVYNIDAGHHAKFLTTKEAMADTQPAPTIHGLHTIYEEARSNNPSHARAEMRVPIDYATDVLVFLDTNVLRNALCSFETKKWWALRLHRIAAASQVLSLQATTEKPQFRTTPQALALTAACVWLVNGLHARPDDGRASRRLMDAILPVTEEHDIEPSAVAYRSSLPRVRTLPRFDREDGDPDEAEEEEEEEEEDDDDDYVIGVPHNPFGLVFFRTLIFVDVPRFHVNGPELPESAYWSLFSMSLPQLQHKFAPTGMVDKSMLVGKRVTTNKVKLPLYNRQTDTPPSQPFTFAAPTRFVPAPAVDEGPDIEDAETPPPAQSINDFATDLLCQFVIDVLGKSPSPRGAANSSYIKLTAAERHSATDEVFKNPVLSDIFRSVAYKSGTPRDWDRALSWLFPARGVEISNNVQNYPNCPYFTKWMTFANDPRSTPVDVDQTRKALVKRIKTWTWIPDACQDKMWPTATQPGFTRAPPAQGARGKPSPAPRILIRANARVEFLEDAE
ncbi:hypothetical protein H0H93_005013 [Arthromyces matolae]|nr:hypothetical protein H0H93_005013 [Arthromyces matolae]